MSLRSFHSLIRTQTILSVGIFLSALILSSSCVVTRTMREAIVVDPPSKSHRSIGIRRESPSAVPRNLVLPCPAGECRSSLRSTLLSHHVAWVGLKPPGVVICDHLEVGLDGVVDVSSRATRATEVPVLARPQA